MKEPHTRLSLVLSNLLRRRNLEMYRLPREPECAAISPIKFNMHLSSGSGKGDKQKHNIVLLWSFHSEHYEMKSYNKIQTYVATLKCKLYMGEGSSTIIVCTNYCNSRKKSFPMVASKKTSEIVVKDG